MVACGISNHKAEWVGGRSIRLCVYEHDQRCIQERVFEVRKMKMTLAQGQGLFARSRKMHTTVTDKFILD